MSYNDETVKIKFSQLNETQDSIVTVAQWVMFHRRYADQTAQLWLQRVKDSGAAKRLNLIYLANEVIQQSKARKKDDFLVAFSPIIAEGMVVAYKSATAEVQNKLRRVVEVWRHRQIFTEQVQSEIERQVREVDQQRAATSSKQPLGGSLFSSGTSSNAGHIPSEIASLVPLQTSLSKAVVAVKPAVTIANNEHANLYPSDQLPPAPPVQAARLNSLLKALAKAENAVVESVKARMALIEGLEKLREQNRKDLIEEEAKAADLAQRRQAADAKHREVEDAIVHNLSIEEFNMRIRPLSPLPGQQRDPLSNNLSVLDHVPRPEVEPLTPPPGDNNPPTPPIQPDVNMNAMFEQYEDLSALIPPPRAQPAQYPNQTNGRSTTPTEPVPPQLLEAGMDSEPLLASRDPRLARLSGGIAPSKHAYPSPDGDAGSTSLSRGPKRRRTGQSEDEAFEALNKDGDALDGLDADVLGMLG